MTLNRHDTTFSTPTDLITTTIINYLFKSRRGKKVRFNINKSELLNALTTSCPKGTASRLYHPCAFWRLPLQQRVWGWLWNHRPRTSIRYSVPALVEEEEKTVIPRSFFWISLKTCLRQL